jgi:hypothetical protein
VLRHAGVDLVEALVSLSFDALDFRIESVDCVLCLLIPPHEELNLFFQGCVRINGYEGRDTPSERQLPSRVDYRNYPTRVSDPSEYRRREAPEPERKPIGETTSVRERSGDATRKMPTSSMVAPTM